MNYLDIYTKVRQGTVSFHKFMEDINDIYQKAYLKGNAEGIQEVTGYLQQVIGETENDAS
jgi:hypothetical protein